MLCTEHGGDCTLCSCQKMQNCTRTKGESYNVRTYLNTQKRIPKNQNRKSPDLVRSEAFPLGLRFCSTNCSLNCRTKPGGWGGGQVVPKAEERKGKQGTELLPAGPRLLPSLKIIPIMGCTGLAHTREVPTDAPVHQPLGKARRIPQSQTGCVSSTKKGIRGYFAHCSFPRASCFTPNPIS